MELGTSAHQFFDERRTDALRATDNQLHEFFGDAQPSGIQLREFRTSLLIRERKLYRLIDASGLSTPPCEPIDDLAESLFSVSIEELRAGRRRLLDVVSARFQDNC